jgi:alkanesulfonate monooxygenase
MKVEFIGIAHTNDVSETNAASGPVVQPDYLYRLARVHEQSGFDRVLVAHSSAMPDGFTVAIGLSYPSPDCPVSRLGVHSGEKRRYVHPIIAEPTRLTEMY